MLTPQLPLRLRLDQLETWLELPDTDRSDLPVTLGEGEALGQLLTLGLAMMLRRGPCKGHPDSPRHLVETASSLARQGRLPLHALLELDDLLAELTHSVRQRDALRAKVPLWWEDAVGILAANPLVELGRSWRRELELPSGERLAHGHTVLPGLLPPRLVGSIARELTTLGPAGLGLERAGVGQSGALSARRSDSVRYLEGREPDLLDQAPTLATLVQWLLASLSDALGSVRGTPVFPPRRAMLAHYPAPSVGYAPHLDNPGNDDDNGRQVTAVLYLNAHDTPCQGGEIALWNPGHDPGEPADHTVEARGGTAVLFESRRVPHQVRPLTPGPARWALTLWFNAEPQGPPRPEPTPRPTTDEVILAIPRPKVAGGRLLVHQVVSSEAGSRLAVWPKPSRPLAPTLAIVATVYGEGPALATWCQHHLDLGVVHLLLVFDHLDEPAETTLARHLEARFGDRLTVWSGAETTARRWSDLAEAAVGELVATAGQAGAADAVAARQTLNASCALQAFSQGLLDPKPDWLLHLDGDERLVLAGSHRGGSTLAEHLAAAETAGLSRLRYLPHELLEPPTETTTQRRYKLNPHLAEIALGSAGWRQLVDHLAMGQDAPRPYFRAHSNGKSAVRIEAAQAAAGVHGWRLTDPSPERGAVVAGPFVLHDHFQSSAVFRRKYRAMAKALRDPGDLDRLFPPSNAERRAVETVRRLSAEGTDDAAIDRALDQLHQQLVRFTPQEVGLLEAAGLLVEPPEAQGGDG